MQDDSLLPIYHFEPADCILTHTGLMTVCVNTCSCICHRGSATVAPNNDKSQDVCLIGFQTRPREHVQPNWLPIVCVYGCVCESDLLSHGSPNPTFRPMLSFMAPLPVAVVRCRAGATQYSRLLNRTIREMKGRQRALMGLKDTHTHAPTLKKHV